MAKKYKLVLSGSGMRFPVFVGALKRLYEEGIEITEVCGTSGGAIVAAGLACGYDPASSMIDLCREFLPKTTKFLDPSIISLLFSWGLIKGEIIEKEFKKYYAPTFKDTKIPLRIITVNYETHSIKHPYNVFSTHGTPDVDLSKAVRASMSIPIVFSPVIINGDRHVDGGLGANFPVDIFGQDEKVIGLHFGGGEVNRSKKPKGMFGLPGYMLDMIDIMMSSTTREYIEDVPNAKIFRLKTDVNTLDFFISIDDVNKMIEEGYNQVEYQLRKGKVGAL